MAQCQAFCLYSGRFPLHSGHFPQIVQSGCISAEASPHSVKKPPFPGIKKAERGRTPSGQMTSFLHFISLEGKSLSLSPYILTSYQSKHAKRTTQASYQNLGGYIVEARGVEPLSEDSATRASPSAVCVLKFPHARAHRQARAIGSFMNPTCGKAYAGWFPTLMTPSTRAVGSPGSTGGIKPRPAQSWNRCYSQLLFFPLLRGSGPRLASRTTGNPRRNQYAPV